MYSTNEPRRLIDSEDTIARRVRKLALDSLGLDGVRQANKDGTVDYAIAREGGMNYNNTPLALQRLFDLYLSHAIEQAVRAAGHLIETEGWDVSTPERREAFERLMTPTIEEHAMALAFQYLDKLKDADGNPIPDSTFKALLAWKEQQQLSTS